MIQFFKKYNVVIILLIIIPIIIVQYLQFVKMQYVFIDNISVYKEFVLTQELQEKTIQIFKLRKNKIDSLQFLLEDKKLRLIKNNSNLDAINEVKSMEEELYYLDQKFQEESKTILAHNEKEIWTQLNQYIKDFGEKKGYHFIFGVSGEGNIMYAKEGRDKSDEAIKYINERYNGSNQ